MRLIPLSVGYVRIGWHTWSGNFGLSWGFCGVPTRYGEKNFRYRHGGHVTFVIRESWQDFGWWALWPVHFFRHTFSRWDVDVYNHQTGQHKLYLAAVAWTGRASEIAGMTINLFGFRWYVRLP